MWNKIKTYKIEERLFAYMLVFGTVLGGINIVNNLIIGFPSVANYKWAVLMITSMVSLFFTLKSDISKSKAIHIIKIITFSEIIFIFLPNGWIYTGSSGHSTMAYVFLICIAICFVCRGMLRIFFLISEIGVVLVMLILSQQYPEILLSDAQSIQFVDNLIQVPTTIIAASLILILYSNAFMRERQMLSEFSEMLVQKNEALIEMTIKDELTSLYNRRYIFDRLQELWMSLDVYKSVRLALVDVDNFKVVNDTYGHVIGDHLLKKVSKIMNDQVKEIGFAGRYGGDEFVLVFVDQEIDHVISILEEINKQVRETKIEGKGLISLSGGLTRLTRENNVDEALSRADDILYKSKRHQKNAILSDEDVFRL